MSNGYSNVVTIGVQGPPGTAVGSQVYVRETESPYTAQLSDGLILLDNSATGNRLTITFENAPVAGTKRRVMWWAGFGGTGGAPPLIVAAGAGIQIASWTSSGGQASLGAQTSITQLGGEGIWEFVGTTVNGVVVNAWVLEG